MSDALFSNYFEDLLRISPSRGPIDRFARTHELMRLLLQLLGLATAVAASVVCSSELSSYEKNSCLCRGPMVAYGMGGLLRRLIIFVIITRLQWRAVSNNTLLGGLVFRGGEN